jgi:hypothetical protein
MKRTKRVSKKSSSKKSTDNTIRSRLRNKTLPPKRLLIIVAGLIFIGAGYVLTLPKTYERTEEYTLGFNTKFEDEKSIELGEEKIAQEGEEGVRYVKYKYTQSLFDYLFRRDNFTKEEIDSRVLNDSQDRIVLNGTKKWQYMMCSDGSYRYFTDEQFKNRFTGFTSKSPDNCAENNQGKKISLADSPSGINNATRPTYVPPNCSVVDIPYQTVYQDADWLYVGEIQEGYGVDGFRYVCSDGSGNFTYDPINKITYRGTRKEQSSTYSTVPSEPTQDSAAKWQCDSEYNSAKAQISMAGSANSSAMLVLQDWYARCLSKAGY